MVGGSSRWVGIPELHLQHLALHFGTACVLDGCCVVARERSQGTNRADWWDGQSRCDESRGCEESLEGGHRDAELILICV